MATIHVDIVSAEGESVKGPRAAVTPPPTDADPVRLPAKPFRTVVVRDVTPGASCGYVSDPHGFTN